MTAAQTITAMRMTTAMPSAYSRKRLWTGRIVTGLAGAFLILDASMKVLKLPFVVQSTVQVGYPESTIAGIGLALLVSTMLYLIPRTSILGAILLTGYLGGAVATHVRVSGPWFNVLFPVLFGCFVWGGLYLRDKRLWSVLPGDTTVRY